MRTLILLGLVGGVGSGKSTVARAFATLGAHVIDADRLAHDCLETDAVRAHIRDAFGAAVFEGARVSRAQLGAIVFADAERLHRLNAIVHPCVHARIDHALSALRAQPGPPLLVVLDVPLLLESAPRTRCDHVLFVDAARATRLARVRQHRGWDQDELQRREKNQKALAEKSAAADYKLTNEGPEEAILSRVQAIHDDIMRRASAARSSDAPAPASADHSETN